MKTQDDDTVGTQPASRQPGVRAGGKRWLAGLGAIVVVALVIGVSVLVFAQAGQHRGTQVVSTVDTSRRPMAADAQGLQYNVAGCCKH